MTNAYHDENGVATIISVANIDGTTIVRNIGDPISHRFKVNDSATGTDAGNNKGNAMKDENGVKVVLAVSSQTTTVNGINYIQGVTPVEVYADPGTLRLLINSH